MKQPESDHSQYRVPRNVRRKNIHKVKVGGLTVPPKTPNTHVFAFDTLRRKFNFQTWLEDQERSAGHLFQNDIDVINDSLKTSEYFPYINIYRNFWLMNLIASILMPPYGMLLFYNQWDKHKAWGIIWPLLMCCLGIIISIIGLLRSDQWMFKKRTHDFRKRLCELYILYYEARNISFTVGERGLWISINLDYKTLEDNNRDSNKYTNEEKMTKKNMEAYDINQDLGFESDSALNKNERGEKVRNNLKNDEDGNL